MFDVLSEKFESAFKTLSGQGKISESNIDQALKDIRTALLEADVHFKVVKDFLTQVKEKALGQKVISGVNPGQLFTKIVHDELTTLMGSANQEIAFNSKPPKVILVVGLNGAGKTTFCGKLALFLRQKYKKEALLLPADNYRPAAKEQLLTHAKNLGVDFVDSNLSLSVEEIVQEGLTQARMKDKDALIIDTAGRLQVDEELMDQLVRVHKLVPEAEVLLVADAMTGQEAVHIAEVFHAKVALSGIVLSKMDSDTRGGAALSIFSMTKVPIKFVSVGEKLKDLEPFYPDRLASRLLDMGDVVSLVEKAQEVIETKDAEAMMKKMQKNQFTMDDFLKQMEMMQKLGSMESLLKMIPGMGGMMRQIGDLGGAEDEMKKIRVIISSMTKQERQDHKILNGSRRERIAKGCGRSVQDINQFVTKFEQMKKMMSGLMGMMGGGGMGALGGLMGMGAGGDAAGGFTPGFRRPKGVEGKQKVKGKRGSFGTRFF